MTNLTRAGGFASLVCAATYLIGFALLLTVFAPLGFGSNEIDAAAVVAFIGESPGILIVWNTIIYIVNALALAVLVVALAGHTRAGAPAASAVGQGIGLIWAALVLGAGMLANVTVETVATMGASSPESAAETWRVLHAVELGLGGGNEIAGAVWVLTIAIAGLAGATLPRLLTWFSLLLAISGLLTVIPALGEITGAIFGLGFIAWFIWTGIVLLRAGSVDQAA